MLLEARKARKLVAYFDNSMSVQRLSTHRCPDIGGEYSLVGLKKESVFAVIYDG
jgi:hypothetical protein